MALAVNSEMPTNTGQGQDISGTNNTFTFNFTNAGGGLVLLLVDLGVPGPRTATFGAVSYGGVAMTKQLEATTSGAATGGKIGVYYLLTTATTSQVVSINSTNDTTGAEDVSFQCGCISFTGHDTSTPIKQTITAQGSGTTATQTLTGVTAGNITVAVAGAGSALSGPTQTLSWLVNTSTGNSMGCGASSRSASSGSVAHAFTIGGTDSWAEVIVEIAAAGGVAPAAPTLIVNSGNRW